MLKRYLILLSTLCALTTLSRAQTSGPADSATITGSLLPVFKKWTVTELVKGGRIDAIRRLEGSTILCATRGLNRGKLFISRDNGNTWQFLAQPTPNEITCIAETGNKMEFYILTGQSEVFGTLDGGQTFQHLTTLTTNKNREHYTTSYAIMYTLNGTLLVTDTDSDGGHIYRSTDKGKTWTDLGAVSKNALYRLEKIGNAILVNGWEGNVYRSADDGITWNKAAKLSTSALFATEYLGLSKVVQADQAGHIYQSTNLGYVWERTADLTDAADDFINIDYGAVYYSTYTGKKEVYLSLDYGNKWWSIGKVPTGADGDWLDHGISYSTPDSIIILAGTNKGFIIRNAISREWLYAAVNQATGKKMAIASQKILPLLPLVKGSVINDRELDEPEDILINDGFAYIPCRDGNNVAVFDYHDETHPKLACSIRDPDILDAFSVRIKDHYLFVLSMTNCRISVYDVKDPYHPQKISAITVGGEGSWLDTYRSNYTRLRKLYIEGDYAYVTHSSESKVYILDIHDPVHPSILSSFHTGDGAFAVLSRGNALYLAGYGPGSSVIAVDISDKRHPVITSRIKDTALLAGTCALAIAGDKLYVTAYHANTFWVMDISDPLQLKTVSYIRDEDMQGPGRVAVADGIAYVINSTNDCLAAIDVTDAAHPHILSFIQDRLIKRVYGIAIDPQRHLLLLAGREARSFVVIDLPALLRRLR